MAKHRITDKVSFGCQSCGSNKLLSQGAVRTEEDKIYFAYTCEDCGEAVPIEVNQAIASLYSATSAPITSHLVN